VITCSQRPTAIEQKTVCPWGCVGKVLPVSSSPAFEGWVHGVLECSSCGIWFSVPYSSSMSEDDHWDDLYHANYSPYRKKLKHRHREARFAWLSKHRLAWLLPAPLRPSFPVAFGSKRSLEIGCGSGADLRRLVDLGWDATGLEPHEEAAKRARQWSGATVLVKRFPTRELLPSSFDFILAQQVLEHLPSPVQAGREIAKLLRPGGVVQISVPNCQSWAAQKFGPHWAGWDVPRHRIHFTPHSLAQWGRASGLVDVRVQTLIHAGWIRRSARQCVGKGSTYLSKSRLGASLAARWGQWNGQGDSLLLLARKPLR
jgi:SAM-dependent methyltransferase